MILHSPTEPKSVVRSLERVATPRGITVLSSLRTERMGVDFAWRAHNRWWGVQRKELNDFLASLDDGRLDLEIAQMRSAITMPVLVLEGRINVANGHVMTSGYNRPLSLSGLHKRLLTIQSRDVAVFQVPEVAHTASLVVDHYEWTQADGHSTAATRPKPSGDWGKPTNRDYQIHLLTGLPGVGKRTAAAILDGLGRMPLTMDCTTQELCTVPGIGPKMARAIIAATTTEGDK